MAATSPSKNNPRYWLFKSEPSTYSIYDLAKKPDQVDFWDGVRNYQARNIMRDEMRIGDLGIFYHSSCAPPGAAGVVCVASECQPDLTAQDPNSNYYDQRASETNPIWMAVNVRLIEIFSQLLTLPQMRAMPALGDMTLMRKGMRLSVQPVSEEAFWHILVSSNSKLKSPL